MAANNIHFHHKPINDAVNSDWIFTKHFLNADWRSVSLGVGKTR